MASTQQKQIKFSKGQISQDLIERTDLELYNSSAQVMKNFTATVFGGAKTRSGTFKIDSFPVGKVKMIPFIFNNDQKYLIILRNESIDIYRNDIKEKNVVATGLLETFFDILDYTSKDDTILFTHPDMKTKYLQRTSTGWKWDNFDFKNIPTYAFNGETTSTPAGSITPSAVEGAIAITGSGTSFNATYVGQIIDNGFGRVKITSYQSPTKLLGYTIVPFADTVSIATGVWKLIGGYEPVWSDTRGYPRTCSFSQERLFLGGSKSLPSSIWASRIDDYNNFNNVGNYDNDAIDIKILTNEVILSIVENRGIHIFTSGWEGSVPEESYTPDKFSVIKNTTNGSIAGVQPVLINGIIMFIEKNGNSLLGYVYNYEQASFVTDNISLFSNLIEKPVAMSSEVNSSKDRGDFLYLVLNDGSMLVATIVLNQDIKAITPFITQGSIRDVVSILSDTYLLVERGGYYYLEKISNINTDCTTRKMVNTQVVSIDENFNGKSVFIYDEQNLHGKYVVENGSITLTSIPNKECFIGLSYEYEIESNPISIGGKTNAIKKRITKAKILTKNTKFLRFCGQNKQNQSDLFEFYSCTNYKDDVRFTVKGEFYPVDILSIHLDINYEG